MHILIPVLRAGGEAIPLGKNTALVRGYKMSRPDWGFCYARTRNLIVRNSAAGGVYRNCFLGKLPETPPFTNKAPVILSEGRSEATTGVEGTPCSQQLPQATLSHQKTNL